MSQLDFDPVAIPAEIARSDYRAIYRSTQSSVEFHFPTTATLCPSDKLSRPSTSGKRGTKHGICPYMECCNVSGICGASGNDCKLENGCQKGYGSCWDNTTSEFLQADDVFPENSTMLTAICSPRRPNPLVRGLVFCF